MHVLLLSTTTTLKWRFGVSGPPPTHMNHRQVFEVLLSHIITKFKLICSHCSHIVYKYHYCLVYQFFTIFKRLVLSRCCICALCWLICIFKTSKITKDFAQFRFCMVFLLSNKAVFEFTFCLRSLHCGSSRPAHSQHLTIVTDFSNYILLVFKTNHLFSTFYIQF